MTSQGTAHARFTRAIQRGHLLAAETAARELGVLSTADALALCLLYQRAGDARFERAFRRWLGRARTEHALSHGEGRVVARGGRRSRRMTCATGVCRSGTGRG